MTYGLPAPNPTLPSRQISGSVPYGLPAPNPTPISGAYGLPAPNPTTTVTAPPVKSAGQTIGPADVTPNPLISGSLPSPWLDQNIGNVGLAGSASADASGTFTVTGAGGGAIYSNPDNFHYVYQPLNGDGQIIARVNTLQNVNANAEAGVMIRNTLDSGSNYAAIALTPLGYLCSEARATSGANGNSTQTCASNGPYSPPKWLRVIRNGNTFTNSISNDGVNWNLLSFVTVPMTTSVFIGLEVSSYTSGALNTSTFDNVSVTIEPALIPAPLPTIWQDQDVGSVGITGSVHYATNNSGTFIIAGAGGGAIYSNPDSFHYVYQTLNGDGQIIARVKSLQNVNANAEAGVMIRDALDPGSNFMAVALTALGYLCSEARTMPGANGNATQTCASNFPYAAPEWLRIVRTGSIFTSSISNDGITWTTLSTVTIAMAAVVLIGLEVSSYTSGALNTSTLDNVNVSPSPAPPTSSLPSPWVDREVGIAAPSPAGSSAYGTYNSGTYQVRGSGGNAIYGSSDSFHYVYQPFNGNGQIIARVKAVEYVNNNAEAGIMIRNTLDSGSNYAAIALTPLGYLCSEARATPGANGNSTQTCASTFPLAAPQWMKLVRYGNNFTNYISSDGLTWNTLSTVTVPMTTSVFIGLEVSAYNSALLNTSTFDNVQINQVCPGSSAGEARCFLGYGYEQLNHGVQAQISTPSTLGLGSNTSSSFILLNAQGQYITTTDPYPFIQLGLVWTSVPNKPDGTSGLFCGYGQPGIVTEYNLSGSQDYHQKTFCEGDMGLSMPTPGSVHTYSVEYNANATEWEWKYNGGIIRQEPASAVVFTGTKSINFYGEVTDPFIQMGGPDAAHAVTASTIGYKPAVTGNFLYPAVTMPSNYSGNTENSCGVTPCPYNRNQSLDALNHWFINLWTR